MRRQRRIHRSTHGSENPKMNRMFPPHHLDLNSSCANAVAKNVSLP